VLSWAVLPDSYFRWPSSMISWSLQQLRVRVVLTTAPIEEDEASAFTRMGIQAIGTNSEKSLYSDPLY
jgi:hypothetical protein